MSQPISNHDTGNQDFNKMNPEEKILFRASSLRVPEGKSPETALSILKERISGMETIGTAVRKTKTRTMWLVSAIAAGIILLLGLWQIFSFAGETRITAGNGTHADYTLSDGSAIKLNAGSKISFNRRNFVSDRLVSLNGEAFFEVTKGNPFRVNTPTGMVEVLGTSFNVFSRDNSFRVACLTGKVMVTSNNQSLIIEPGERAELTSSGLNKSGDDRTKYVTAWINGEFYFENTPLSLVFKEIERQFNVKFAGRERNDEFFTGSFVNKDLKTALEIVCIPMGLQYEISDNGKISVSNKKR